MADHASTNKPSVTLSNGAYDVVKAIAQYILPGLGALYFALATIWGLGYAEQVIGTITAVDVFLGVILGVLKKAYLASDAPYDGQLVVDTSDPEKDVHNLVLNSPMEDLATKNAITFKVTAPSE